MLDKSNIRFSYEQKNKFLINDNIHNPTLEKLLRQYDKPQPQDEEQEQYLMKKSKMYPGQAAKTSQVYSDVYIQRVDKISPRRQSPVKYSLDRSNLAQQKKYNFQLANSNKPLFAPNSLPHIRKSKQLDQSLNESSIINEFKSVTKGRTFSINHYDIYKPGFLVSRQEIIEASRKRDQKDNSLDHSQVNQQLQEQKPHQPLKINFQNQTDHDMLELNQQEEFSQKQSSIFKKDSQVEKNLLKDLHKEEIVIENNFTRKNEHQETSLRPKINQRADSISRHHRAVSEFRKQRAMEVQQKVYKKMEHPKVPERKQTSMSSKRSERCNKTVNAKINDEKFLKDLQTNQKEQDIFESKSNSSERQRSISEKNNHDKAQSHISKKTEKSLKKQQTPVTNRIYEFHTFHKSDYAKIYDILKTIQTALKSPVLDIHSLLRGIKHYMQIVATGGLDHIQGYDMPPHRLKIIKNGLLYERIAIVIVSFAYAVGKIKQCLKYLINLVNYTSNNTLLILKILQSSQLNKQIEKNPIIAKSDRLILKRNYDSVRNSSDIILDTIFKIAKYEQPFHESFKQIVKNVGRNNLEQTFYNVLEYFSFFLCVSNLHMTIPFLAVAPNPYLRETADKRPTLVIDIVEVFCHGTRKSKSHIFRPHSQYFLNQMAQYYEIISFTSAYPNQIDKVIDILDHKRHIKHRLYRHHALSKQNLVYKDVERIGRDLRRLILLDSQTNAMNESGSNTIMIPSWRGSKNDTFLAELCPILATIAVKNMDCQEAARKINDQHLKNESAGIKYLNFGINLE